MATSAILFSMVIVLAHPNHACFIKNDGPHPWLIRIWLDKPVYEPTIAHGTLVSPRKVLTGGHIVDKVLEKSIDFRKSFDPMTIAMTAYNKNPACQQTQYAKRMYLHWRFENRQNDPFKYCQLGEFAVLIPFQNFDTIGAPFLIPWPYDSRARQIETWLMKGPNGTLMEVVPDESPHEGSDSVSIVRRKIDGTNTSDATTDAGKPTDKAEDPKVPATGPLGGLGGDMVSVYMFADREPNNSNTIEATKVTIMSWLKCKETENFKKVVGDSDLKDPLFTNYTFFCSEKIPGQKGTERLRGGVGYDWHLGAPVMVDWNSANIKMMPIGQYLFWTGDSGIPFVFSTFTQITFDFILGNVPWRTTPNTITYPSPTFPPKKPTYTAFSTIPRKPRTPATSPPDSGCDRHRQRPLWIFIGLLTSIFGLLPLHLVSNPFKHK